MQVEPADLKRVQHRDPLRQSRASLGDQPGIARSLGGQRAGSEVDYVRMAKYRLRTWDRPQNLARPTAIEQHCHVERPAVQVILGVDAGKEHLPERVLRGGDRSERPAPLTDQAGEPVLR